MSTEQEKEEIFEDELRESLNNWQIFKNNVDEGNYKFMDTASTLAELDYNIDNYLRLQKSFLEMHNAFSFVLTDVQKNTFGETTRLRKLEKLLMTNKSLKNKLKAANSIKSQNDDFQNKLNQQTSELTDNIQRLEGSLEKKEEEINSLKNKLLTVMNNTPKSFMDEESPKVLELQNQVDEEVLLLKRELKGVKSKVFKYEKENSILEENLEKINMEKAQFEKDLMLIRQEKSEINQNLKKNTEDLSSAHKEIRYLKAKIINLPKEEYVEQLKEKIAFFELVEYNVEYPEVLQSSIGIDKLLLNKLRNKEDEITKLKRRVDSESKNILLTQKERNYKKPQPRKVYMEEKAANTTRKQLMFQLRKSQTPVDEFWKLVMRKQSSRLILFGYILTLHFLVFLVTSLKAE
eukprot:snap_masked-scaffold_46-processed-gene-0.43-mRNA-1 protein AED:0.04 eAED:0.04 QI:0/-1/0/1/-1/1/1/0/404